MAQTIDTRPQVVDITAYAGDTLTFRVNVPTGWADGLEWKGQVKATRDAAVADADFVIVPDATGAEVTLPAAVTRSLAETSGVAMRVTRVRDGVTTQGAPVLRYTGEWDVQVSGVAGADPVTTLAQGSLTLDLDVTDEA